VHWVRAFIRFHELRHPSELGQPEVEAFLTWLATERQVAPGTHKQALSALLFLYQKVLRPAPAVDGRNRPPARAPPAGGAVRGRSGGRAAATGRAAAAPGHALWAGRALLYGTGMRLLEGCACA
jgi:hypothetical protein